MVEGPEWSFGENEQYGIRKFILCWKGRNAIVIGSSIKGDKPNWTEIYSNLIHELQNDNINRGNKWHG